MVSFKYLDEMLEEYGFKKVKVENFGEIYESIKDLKTNEVEASKMSEVEKEFSYLNNAFIYKKVENVSDKLYKKLDKMIKKST